MTNPPKTALPTKLESRNCQFPVPRTIYGEILSAATILRISLWILRIKK